MFQIPSERAYGADMTSPDSRIWLITGSSSGFGRTLAEAALDAGDRVVATARRPQTLDDLVARAPERVLALPLDVTDQGQIDAAVATARSHFGRIDVLVNNAGLRLGRRGRGARRRRAAGADGHDVLRRRRPDARGAAGDARAGRGRDRADELDGRPGDVSGYGAYCAAKFALEAMSESLAAEVAPFGIRVLIVEPGAFRTAFGGARMQRSRDIGVYAGTVGPTRAAVDAMDGSQPGDPEKAAAAILQALASDAAPLHLALGDDAVDAITAALGRRRSDLEAWEAVSRGTALDA